MEKECLNKIILQQAYNIEGLPDQSVEEPWFDTYPIDFQLRYISTPKNCLQRLIEQILNECLQCRSDRKSGYSASKMKELRGYVRALVLNLWSVHQVVSSCEVNLSVSLTSKDYSSSGQYARYSYAHFKKSIYDPMLSEELGYISCEQAGFKGFAHKAGRRTRIKATDKLIGKLEEAISKAGIFRLSSEIAKKDLVVLKDDNKRVIKCPENAEVKEMRRNLLRVNKLISSADIQLKLPEGCQEGLIDSLRDNEDVDVQKEPYINFAAVCMYRVFNNGQLDNGGRFYGGWWQCVPAKKDRPFRRYISINQESVVELDFKAIHPNILYHERVGGVPEGFDPYQPYKGLNRDYGKIAWNKLLNAKSRSVQEPEGYDLKVNDGLTWREFLEVIIQHNKPIESALGSGEGIRLQYIDSKVAERVMVNLVSEGVVCLPVHDSFIVQEKYEAMLRSAMEQASMEELGFALQVE